MSGEWQKKHANKFVETKGKVLTTRSINSVEDIFPRNCDFHVS